MRIVQNYWQFFINNFIAYLIKYETVLIKLWYIIILYFYNI